MSPFISVSKNIILEVGSKKLEKADFVKMTISAAVCVHVCACVLIVLLVVKRNTNKDLHTHTHTHHTHMHMHTHTHTHTCRTKEAEQRDNASKKYLHLKKVDAKKEKTEQQ